MTGIYKITNRESGLSYIGKSKNIERRWQEHKSDSFCSEEKWEKNKRGEQTYFHKALRKYGENAFDWEIIEECSENQLNEREQFWISYYHTWIHDPLCNGYNLTKGGDGYTCGGGENAPGNKLTQKEVNIIKQKLREHWTAKQIQEIFPNVLNTTISNINNGINWYDPNEFYPISKNNGHTYTDNTIMTIRKEWSNGSNITELAKKYKMSPTTIRKIITGKTYSNLPILERKVDYIRTNKKVRKFTDDEVKYFREQFKQGKSIKFLHENECPIKCCYATFYNMVKGKNYKNVI